MALKDFLFRGTLKDLDPAVAELLAHEATRQAYRIILIPSESAAPKAVLEAVGSVMQNVYAEGYPHEDTRWLDEEEILDYEWMLANYRRYSDRRYYKGVEYADILEALARRRCAQAFAGNGLTADDLYVNVQPLSGAPANTAVYEALLEPGDTVMGLDLLHGGHLTHGSPANRSGKYYNIVSYTVDPETELLDYDAIEALAREVRPKMIIAGFTSYPWAADWIRFREIADSCGAYLLADIAHVAGMVAAGVYPNPVGIADVVSFTTHKTLGGPRGACLITHRKDLHRKIDHAVFPGEQGGPHMNAIAGMAVAFKLAQTPQFRRLQEQTVRNAARLAERLADRGFRIPYGGTDTHLLLVDCKSVTGPDGTPLSGDMAARILDLVGIVVNRNTIPGDKSPARATGIRLGTPWATQRGFREGEIDRLADIIADVLLACTPFSYVGKGGRPNWRAKVEFGVLQDARARVSALISQAGMYEEVHKPSYPHFPVAEHERRDSGWTTLEIEGDEALHFLDYATTGDVCSMEPNQARPTWVLRPDGEPITRAVLVRLSDRKYHLHVAGHVDEVATWLRDLSDGYVGFDPEDVYAKLPGPVVVRVMKGKFEVPEDVAPGDPPDGYTLDKPYYIGIHGPKHFEYHGDPLPTFSWSDEAEGNELKKTSLNTLHRQMGAKMVPFAGWDMPVWYTGVSDEHRAVRERAGIFDVAHMGVFEISGRGAEPFLNTVTTNDVSDLAVGQAHYSYLLGIDGIPIDDIFLYRVERELYLMVVNASNNDKDWEWLNGVLEGRYAIDSERPWVKAPGRESVTIRDLRDPGSGDDMRVDIALQGPLARNVLLSLKCDTRTRNMIATMPWASVVRAEVGGYDLIVARTGYTGERVAFELFVHPDKAPDLFRELVDAGAVPCGLASRDSTRTEAGLPLYGHELAGPLNLGPADAGFARYVKLWKPFFVGKAAYVRHEGERDSVVVRFRMNDKGVKRPVLGDPVVDRRGRVIGTVTSCAIDTEGYLLGQAYVKLSHAEEGTQIGIFALGGRAPKAKSLADLKVGDRVTVPQAARVLSRFPRR